MGQVRLEMGAYIDSWEEDCSYLLAKINHEVIGGARLIR